MLVSNHTELIAPLDCVPLEKAALPVHEHPEHDRETVQSGRSHYAKVVVPFRIPCDPSGVRPESPVDVERVRVPDGEWTHRAETLLGVSRIVASIVNEPHSWSSVVPMQFHDAPI